MKFWDTSAIVPLCVVEPATSRLRPIAEADPSLVVWWATRTECMSGFARLRRERKLPALTVTRAEHALMMLSREWSEVLPGEGLRARAERLLGVHPSRAADAFQLAAALVWSRGETRLHALVSLDERLREAGEREGFQVLPG